MLIGQLALVVTAAYSGAAVYIIVAEHPARMKLENGPLLAQWKQSHMRGFGVRASLAIIGFYLGLLACYLTGDWRWALGAFILIINWPFRIVAIMPVNNRLASMSAKSPSDDLRELMDRWGRLHMVRIGLGTTATAIFVWALS